MSEVSPSETHGPYFGSALTFNECEILAIANIDRKVLAGEAKLYQDKWFDYRPLHPTQATYLFAHHFNRAYGTFMLTAYGKGGGFMAGFTGKDVMNAREKRSFWLLRQKIDEMGVRYDFFMRKAMDWCITAGWRQPPRPCHITTNSDMLVEIANAWALERKAKIQYAKSPRYVTSAFVGGPDQLAYEDYLVGEIAQRPHPRFGIHASLYVHDAIRIETVLRRFSGQNVADAIDHCLIAGLQ